MDDTDAPSFALPSVREAYAAAKAEHAAPAEVAAPPSPARERPASDRPDPAPSARHAEERPAARPRRDVARVDVVPAAVASAPEPPAASLVDEFRASLGPELDYLADDLAPAIRKMVDRLAGAKVDDAIKPFRALHDQELTRVATEETALVMRALDARHPDWKQHEPAMLQLAQTLDPNGLTEAEYLDVLYDAITTRVRRSSASSAEVKTRTLAKAVLRPPHATVADAFRAARAGVRWK